MATPPRMVRAQVMLAGKQAGADEAAGLPGPWQGPATLSRERRSLPVLEAFQEFLDSERRRARRRTVAVTVLFFVLFLLLAGAAFFAGALFYGEVAADMLDVRASVASSHAAWQDAEQKNLSALETFAADASAFRQDVVSRTESFVAARSGLSEQIERTGGELRELREAIARLEAENGMIRDELSRIPASATSAAPQVALSEPPDPAGPDSVLAPDQPAVPPPAEADTPPAALTVFIQPRGAERAIPWRLPIP